MKKKKKKKKQQQQKKKKKEKKKKKRFCLLQDIDTSSLESDASTCLGELFNTIYTENQLHSTKFVLTVAW